MARTTRWEPWRGNGTIPPNVYAFPKRQIDPLIDTVGVRAALDHLNAIRGTSEADRRQAFDNIKKAARYFHMEIYGDTYEEMCARPQVEVLPKD